MNKSLHTIDQYFDWVPVASLAQVKQAISAIIMRDKAKLTEAFYVYMLQDPAAAPLLSVKSVEERLKPGLERWLESLFCYQTDEELQAVLAMQQHVGEVHARAEIPVHLVARGMRLLKREISVRVVASNLDSAETVVAVMRVSYLIDIAFEEMSAAFVLSHDSGIRTGEAYRMFAAGQNLSLERAKQTGALLDWENRLFRTLATEATFEALTSLRNAPFGLWLHHKAPLIFDESSELALIDECMRRIDATLFPSAAPHGSQRQPEVNRTLATAVITEVEQIKYLLANMFDRLTDLEVGRDVLTQLFNRRFLPTILKREIELNRRKGTSFCVMMLDIDFFKRVNDEHGHDAGDRVLQYVAGLLLSQVRASDFVFRYGGEEFLVVLAELDAQQAERVAEKIRSHVEAVEIPLSNERTVKLTLSIGIAPHVGHPDFEHLVARADQALFAAKHGGRNRCALAPA